MREMTLREWLRHLPRPLNYLIVPGCLALSLAMILHVTVVFLPQPIAFLWYTAYLALMGGGALLLGMFLAVLGTLLMRSWWRTPERRAYSAVRSLLLPSLICLCLAATFAMIGLDSVFYDAQGGWMLAVALGSSAACVMLLATVALVTIAHGIARPCA